MGFEDVTAVRREDVDALGIGHELGTLLQSGARGKPLLACGQRGFDDPKC
jgi:hypothetical protein